MRKDIKYAIKDEKSAVPMYQKIKSSLKYKKDKHLIDMIIADEKKHKKYLQRINRR